MTADQPVNNPFWRRFRDGVPMKDLMALQHQLPDTVVLLGDPNVSMDEIMPTFPAEFRSDHPDLMNSLGSVATTSSVEQMQLAS